MGENGAVDCNACMGDCIHGVSSTREGNGEKFMLSKTIKARTHGR